MSAESVARAGPGPHPKHPGRRARRRVSRGPVDRLPFALAILAMLVRLPQLGWGLPLVEEEALPMKKALEMCGWVSGRVTLDPNTAGWPSLSFYVHMVLQAVQYWFGRITGIYPSPPDFMAAYLLDPGPVLMIARLLSVVLVGAITARPPDSTDARSSRTTASSILPTWNRDNPRSACTPGKAGSRAAIRSSWPIASS